MTNTVNSQVIGSDNGMIPVDVNDNMQVISVGHMLEIKDEAVVLRGPKKHGMIATLLSDVDWSLGRGNTRDNSYLIIDTPPGTSDEHLSAINLIK